MKEIASIAHPASAATAIRPGAPTQPQGSPFGEHLKQALGEVNDLQTQADDAIRQLVGEGKGDLQETMVALEQADVSFRLMMQIRNRILDAYQEIMRMQV